MKCYHLPCFVLAILSPGALSPPPATAQTSPEPKTAADWFQRADAQMNLRTFGSAPFHMKAIFHAFPGEEMLAPKQKPEIITGDGVYEETWLAPHHWRREVTLANYHAVEVESDKGRKVQASSDYEPSRVLMLLRALLYPIPPELLLHDSDAYKLDRWSIASVSSGSISLVSVQSRIAIGDRFTLHDGYYFLPQGLLVFEKLHGVTTSWQNDVLFAGKLVPGRVTIQAAGLKTNAPDRELLTATVSIEAEGQSDPAAFDLTVPVAAPGITLRPLSRVDRPPQRLTDPNIQSNHDGVVEFMGVLDRAGAYREAEIISAENAEDLHQKIEEVRRIRYSPAELDGSRCEILTAFNLMMDNRTVY